MYRQTNYPWQEPFETDFLYAQRFPYEGLGLLAMDLLGSTALVSGLPCTPTGPASMSVQIGPGRLYSKQNLEPTAWGQLLGIGGLAVDTTADHQILKQGLFRDTTVLTAMTAPVTVGQSQNYLIQAAFSEVDAVPQSLPFVSSTPPYPPIAPTTLNTVRQDLVVITVKGGTPATTGSQTTPAPDASNVGLWVVTIAQGQTSITSGNISAYGSAPFITETLTQKISQAFADARYLQTVNARTRLTANTTFFVRTDGNDANTGLANTAGGAWLSIQHAVSAIQSAYDLNGFVATIQLADGAYAGISLQGVFTGATKGPDSVIINGNSGTPANVTITSPIICQDFCEIKVQNCKMTGAAAGIQSLANAVISLGVGMILATTGASPIFAPGGNIYLNNNITVSGNNTSFMNVFTSGAAVYIAAGITITFTGTPVYSSGLLLVTELGNIHFAGVVTFSGAITGVQYNVATNGVILTSGTTIPGSAGSTSSGGQVV